MKKLLYIIVAGIIVACSSDSDRGKQAAETAKTIYDSLFAGRADLFVRAHYDADSLPEKYISERIDNAKMFVKEQDDEHRGVYSVRISRYEANDSLHTANVYLILCFGDSTNEEVLVPMIEHSGEWKMK